jgi:cellulose biosynthesis protein BcsQ
MQTTERQGDTVGRSGTVLCIASAKGGTGKTLLSVSIASLLTDIGSRVLLIDTDFSTRGLSLYVLDNLSNTRSLNIPPENCLADVLIQGLPFANVAPLTVSKQGEEYAIIVPNSNFRNGGAPEDELLRLGASEGSEPNFESRYFKLLKSITDKYRKTYDFIVIDTRGGYDYSSKIPAVLADGYIVVMEADPNSVTQVFGLKSNVDDFGKQHAIQPHLMGFIVNKALFSEHQGAAFSSALSALYGGKVFGIIPADRRAILAYQGRKVPRSSHPGSDFSHFGLEAIAHVIGSIGSLSHDQEASLNKERASVRKTWLSSHLLAGLQQLYPTLILILLTLVVVLLRGYLSGSGWATIVLIKYAIFGCIAVSTVMPFVLMMSQSRTWSTSRGWIPQVSFSIICSLAIYSVIPTLRSSLSQDVFFEQAKSFQEKLTAARSQLQQQSIDLTKKTQTAELSAQQITALQAQLTDARTQQVAIQDRESTVESTLAKTQSLLLATQNSLDLANKQRNPTLTATLYSGAVNINISCLAGEWKEQYPQPQIWNFSVDGSSITITRADNFVSGSLARAGNSWIGSLKWGNGDIWNNVILTPTPDCTEVLTNQTWYYHR